MMRLARVFAFSLLGCSALVISSPRASARIEPRESIEFFTADADIVVRGIIAEISYDDRPGPGPGRVGFLAEIRVTETLKGPKGDKIMVVLPTLSPELARWREQKTDLLFALVYEGADESSCHLSLRHGLAVIALDDPRAGVVTMDFEILATRDAILRAARAGCAAMPHGASRVRHRIEPPRSSEIGRTLSEFAQVTVVMPVDARLEQRGQKWARSESIAYRYLAPTALSPFPSEKNIGILKQLLSDELHEDARDTRGGLTIRYPVRRRAYLVLRKWGVAVEEPVDEVYRRTHDLARVGQTRDPLAAVPLAQISTVPTLPPFPDAR